MRKLFVLFAAGLACTAVACLPTKSCGAELDPVAVSVRIDRPEGNGVSHHGSGTIVAVEGDQALILTNKHVAPIDAPTFVKWPDGRTTPARWIAADETADLAALSVAAPKDCPAAPPAEKPVPAGVTVIQVGYPRTVGPIRRVGRALANIGWLMTGARVTHASVITEQGDSGSGVFADGHLVGVVWGGSGGTCSCVALEDVHRFCRSPRVAAVFPLQAAKSMACPAGIPDCKCGCAAGGKCICAAATPAQWKPDGTGDLAYHDGAKWVGWWRKDRGGFIYAGETKVYPCACPVAAAPVFTMPAFGGCAGGCCGGRCGR
jgi:hypothetical protein